MQPDTLEHLYIAEITTLCMRAIKLTLALLAIPRLFVSLLLFPLGLSLLLVYSQLLCTGVLVRAGSKDVRAYADTMERLNQKNIARQLIYGSSEELAPLQVCRWKQQFSEGGGAVEIPPNEYCSVLGRLDVALWTDDPANFDTTPYEEVFNGNSLRLHVCRRCEAGIVIRSENGDMRADTKSIWGIGMLALSRFNPNVQSRYLEAFVALEQTRDLWGSAYLHANGFREPILITGLMQSVAPLINVAFLIIVALFLALKAHRKVLDYFASNGALLPMVSAMGKHTFYASLWMLTLLRVGAFLMAGVPILYLGLQTISEERHLSYVFGDGPLSVSLWIIATCLSLTLATLVASISDLKHRHSFLSFAYKYIPLFICLVGAGIWLLTFLADSNSVATVVRSTITSLPIAGLASLLLAPLFKPDANVLAFHAILAAGLVVILMKRNSRWFAAHLEEI